MASSLKALPTIVPPTLPDAHESACQVVGCCLWSPGLFASVADHVHAADFWSGQHRAIWEAMSACLRDGVDVDLGTVTERLERLERLEDAGGRGMLAALVSAGTSPSSVPYHVGRVLDARRKRQAIAALSRCDQSLRGPDASLSEACEALTGTIGTILDGVEVADRKAEFLHELIDWYDTSHDDAMHTGFESVDHHVGGVAPQELIVIAGRPKSGKTWTLLSILKNLAMAGVSMVVTSGEIGPRELYGKLSASIAGICYSDLRMRCLSDRERLQWSEALQKLSRLPVYVVPMSSSDGIACLRHEVKQRKPRILAIDSAYLMADAKLEGWEKFAALSREIKGLARDCNVAVLISHQLNRSREIGYSDAFLQDASLVLEMADDRLRQGATVRTMAARDCEPFEFSLEVDFGRSYVGEKVGSLVEGVEPWSSR